MTGLITADIWKDPRAIAAAVAFWPHVRPGLVRRLMDDHRRLDRMLGVMDTLDRFTLLRTAGYKG